MTTTQRNAITAPTAVTGLMVYDTDLNLYIFNGFWKRATIGELPIILNGNVNNLGTLKAYNTATSGGLEGYADTGTGISGQTESGIGIRGAAITTGVAGIFYAQTGQGIFVQNTTSSNAIATARFLNNTVGGKALDVTGNMTLTTNTTGDAVSVTNTSTSTSAGGVIGVSESGVGITGSTTTGTGTFGLSSIGNGAVGSVGSTSSGVSSNGVYGSNNGAGTGVKGISASGTGGDFSSTSGKGINVENTSATLPTATLNNTSGGTALEINGAIKVSGSSPAALRLEATTNVFFLPVPSISANTTDDLLFVTRATGTGGGTSTSYYAKWTGSDWEIRREDAGTITAGTLINVLVIKQ
ncbi:MAG: hypothetical protein U5N85_01270 [Arcicella sp.]|nr:hypothetical protein [Arcicella sp.]